MKKNFKLVLALVLAAMMIVSMIPAFGATGDLNVNGKLEVSGLDDTDKVAVYKVLGWDENNANGWVWANGVDATAINDSAATLTSIIGTSDGNGQITSVIAGDLAKNKATALATNETVSGGKWSKEVTEAGLYMVIVTPGKPGTIYNPIFVAANWYQGAPNDGPDSSNAWVVDSTTLTYADKAMAKKSTFTVDKKALGNTETFVATGDDTPGAYTNKVGDIVKFQVTTTVPHFAANYINPVYKLKDTLTAGLELQTGTVKLYKFDDTKTDNKGAEITDTTNIFTLSDTSASGWTITFKPDWLKGTNTAGENLPASGLKVVVEYSAKVTNEAEKIVNQDTNTVDLIFSNTPEDETGKGLIRDETNHFTFSIDAGLLGNHVAQGSSTEAIKVGVDKEGNYIVASSSSYWSNETHGPLAGAEFKLYKDEACTQPYINDLISADTKFYSDAAGRLTIKGLDVGDYWLKEEKAPAGYIKLQDSVKVEIRATISTNVRVEDEVNNAGEKVQVTYYTNKLDGYSVKVGGSTTTYVMQNSSNATIIDTSDGGTNLDDEELKNTKGVELPSTGGIGTTIFYVGGSLMVLAAAILLITKRRMGAED